MNIIPLMTFSLFIATYRMAMTPVPSPVPQNTALRLPASAPLSDVEITLAYETHGGCPGRCIKYRVSIRGDGLVQYEDFGGEPRDSPQRRSIPVDDVVSIINDFLKAGFFDAPARYEHPTVARRDRNSLVLLSHTGADGPEWDLTLRFGAQVKTVHLYLGYPPDLARLRDIVEQVGGPKAWIP